MVIASFSAAAVAAAAFAMRQLFGAQSGDGLAVTVQLEPVVNGLDHPWSFAFLPDGGILLTERGGRLRLARDGHLSEPIQGLPQVSAVGQGGLLDAVLHPQFEVTRMLFLSFAEPRDGGNATAVMRGTLSRDERRLENVEVIFQQQPPHDGGNHFGSRLVFDRSGALFVTLGDRNALRHLVQDPSTHIGKIVRITEDGGVPADNPKPQGWLPDVWSMGHRNVQGAALHPGTGALWTVEHGARGGDELNRPQAAKNYGWPLISYGREYSGGQIGDGTGKPGLEQPLHYWDPSIAPSGMAFLTSDIYPGWRGNLFVGALAQQHVARLVLDGDKVIAEERLFEGVARFRDVRQGPDGYLYLLTDEAAPDGRLLRVVPAS